MWMHTYTWTVLYHTGVELFWESFLPLNITQRDSWGDLLFYAFLHVFLASWSILELEAAISLYLQHFGLEFEPFIFNCACNIWVLKLFMLHGILRLGCIFKVGLWLCQGEKRRSREAGKGRETENQKRGSRTVEKQRSKEAEKQRKVAGKAEKTKSKEAGKQKSTKMPKIETVIQTKT